jgi:hypothetical protein
MICMSMFGISLHATCTGSATRWHPAAHAETLVGRITAIAICIAMLRQESTLGASSSSKLQTMQLIGMASVPAHWQPCSARLVSLMLSLYNVQWALPAAACGKYCPACEAPLDSSVRLWPGEKRRQCSLQCTAC